MSDTERAKRIIDFFKKEASEISVFLVINMKTQGFSSNDIYDLQTEYFSDEELGDFINVLEELGIYHEISYGEKEFAQKVIFGKIPSLRFKYKIVYNTTGGGKSRSKSSIVPAICELYGLSYASSDIFSSSLLENKVQSFALLKFYQLQTPHFWIYDNVNGWLNGQPSDELKLISKPAYGCASLGISSRNVSFFTENYELMISKLARKLNQPIIVQEFISGWEVEMPVFDLGYPVTFVPVGVKINETEHLGEDILTYELVSEDRYSFYDFEAYNLQLANKIREIARHSFNMLSLKGSVRVDFRITSDGQCYITDYNNSPHLTRFHSYACSASYAGFSYSEMFCLCLYKAIQNIEY
ncbi:ATP-grasp domain-containing protein [Dysgonomonas sp. GY75]|uniref:ATP-grasp domain-containing protein n=1 Tax=Dysgonomonas sp. GY75 TaxID=2780419 RepID=UPI001883BD7D|nr:ATP-grasp domain-containing protein [Dysgonomonas sp. GY75]MBF0650419.1 ATP-grasp domain-containing protein [Dysgonomonas sp. GY75]